jgi:TfoX/Sxy family transcriptional regulator of competence genes
MAKNAPVKPRRKMPKFTKPPAALVALFQGAVDKLPDVQQRQMFGFPAAFTNTQMFACLFNANMILRLSDGDRATLTANGWRPFEPMPGRGMREYLTVPEAVLKSRTRLHAWLISAHTYASSLPPKTKR